MDGFGIWTGGLCSGEVVKGESKRQSKGSF